MTEVVAIVRLLRDDRMVAAAQILVFARLVAGGAGCSCLPGNGHFSFAALPMTTRGMDGSPCTEEPHSLAVKVDGMPIEFIHATLGVTFVVLWVMIAQFSWPRRSAGDDPGTTSPQPRVMAVPRVRRAEKSRSRSVRRTSRAA